MSFLLMTHLFTFGAIESVTLYTDRAQVTRAERVACIKGTAEARFKALPESAVAKTFSAWGEKGFDVVGLRRLSRVLTEPRDSRISELSADIESLDQQISELEGFLDAQTQRRRIVDVQMKSAERQMNRQLSGDDASTSQWQSLMDYALRERVNITKNRFKKIEELERLRRERSAKQLDLGKLGGNGSRSVTDVTVDLRCTRSGVVRLSYVVSGATWSPGYDLYVNEGGKDHLRLNAKIRQQTGEDWENVVLKVSTASPREGSEAPQLRPIRLTAREREKSKVIIESTEDRSDLDAPAGTPPFPVDDDTSLLLGVDKRANVPSDGYDHWARLARFDVDAKLEYVSVPKLSAYIFRVAAFDNPAPYVLLPGPLSSFLNQTYVGTSRIEKSPRGKSMEVTMGVETAIAVHRDAAYRPDEVKGWFSKDRILKRGYRYRVRNDTQKRIELVLRENFPVSKTEDLIVSLDEETSTAGLVDAERGLIEWRVPADSGKTGRAQLFFTVELPDDWEVR